MRHAFMEAIAQRFAAHDVATLRWEFLYMSAGKARTDTAAVAEASVRRVWNAARSLELDLPMFAGGKSFGGRMTSRSHAAESLAGVNGIVFLGFPLHPPNKPSVERAEHLADAKGPLLFVQGTRDDLAPLPRLRPVIKKLGKRATLHVVDGADHGFDVLVRSGRTTEEVLEEIARTVAEWMAKMSRVRA